MALAFRIWAFFLSCPVSNAEKSSRPRQTLLLNFPSHHVNTPGFACVNRVEPIEWDNYEQP